MTDCKGKLGQESSLSTNATNELVTFSISNTFTIKKWAQHGTTRLNTSTARHDTSHTTKLAGRHGTTRLSKWASTARNGYKIARHGTARIKKNGTTWHD